jgi:hypothetical protein
MELQVIKQALELRQVESKQPETSEERFFLAARQGLPIVISSEDKLREALRYVMVKVGLRGHNFPVGAEKTLLLNHITLNYGNHTPEEIRLAFDLALSAKLGLDTSDIKCYENFSCAYFSCIMNAYRSWASKVHTQISGGEKPVEVPATQEEIDQIEKEYQDFLKTPLAKKLGKI